MFRFHGMGRPFQVLAALAFLLPQAGTTQDRDTQEIQRYVLTEAGLAKYKAATNKLAALPRTPASDCEETEDTSSITDAVAKADATPGVKAAIASAGMTTREYIVFGFSVFTNGMAAWGLSQPGGKLPPGINPANVDFYKKHAAEIEALPKSGKDDCDEERTGDDDSE